MLFPLVDPNRSGQCTIEMEAVTAQQLHMYDGRKPHFRARPFDTITPRI
jgi:hypothetical protein